MCNLRKVTSSCEQLGSVSICLRPEYIQFCFQNFGNDKEGKNLVDRLLLVLTMKKNQ